MLTAGATAGIALALRALDVHRRSVALPAGVCANVPLAVLYADNFPAYLDCEPETLGLAPAALRAPRPDGLGAVVAVHCYGNPCSIEDIAAHCRAAGLPLIEDAAAALGAVAAGRPAGGWGDISVISFGAGKTIDVGSGGAVLTDDAALADEIRRLEAKLPPADAALAREVEELSRWHTALYNRHYGRDLNRHADEFAARAVRLRDGFVHRCDAAFADSARQALERLPTLVGRRRARWEALYARFERLGRPDIVPHPGVAGYAPWRFNLFFRSGRDSVLRHLLQAEIKVSSWFPPADLYLRPGRGDGDGDTPVASRVGREILNLWVNDEVGDDYVHRVCEEIVKHDRLHERRRRSQ